MNKFRTMVAILLALGLAGTATYSQGCGEVMYRMGSALHYHAFVTHHPARILIYAGPATQQHPTDDATNFKTNLEKAGHSVTVVSNSQALGQVFATRSFDVVLVFAGDIADVNAQIANSAHAPQLIPVIDRNDPNERAMRDHYPRLVTEDASFNQLLKVIEQSMASRGS